eukprot:CAMPEP_0118709226 /NCGR_PEP_ID=MMETSP0800-20121206/22479_1 /TAXON_ID=210618 ORGANISM="Striatella unipunctata, Strain CCMP2910" /NCGR_SAMPLE_ID=MMETSP0800 /ASSEMBLY_ACC=CAM_ASM_000638 /LENGTH=402 /DNA_ID=CAMNT_0006612815 /DNA_START=56 /DNA_END=1264 /DNA_ORIENTATION=-
MMQTHNSNEKKNKNKKMVSLLKRMIPFKKRTTTAPAPAITTTIMEPSRLDELSSEVMMEVLSYLLPTETLRGVQFVNKHLWRECQSNLIWKRYCLYTGKCREDDKQVVEDYKKMYLSRVAVPIDVPTIQEAISMKRRNILLMPGVVLEESGIVVSSSQSVSISATRGTAAIYASSHKNKPCILVTGKKASVQLENVQILHESSSKKKKNNAALVVTGGASLSCKNARITSRSGRGVVAKMGAALDLNHCDMVHCANSGVVLHQQSRGALSNCNLIANGDNGCDVVDGSNLEISNTTIAKSANRGLSVSKVGIATLCGTIIAENGTTRYQQEDSLFMLQDHSGHSYHVMNAPLVYLGGRLELGNDENRYGLREGQDLKDLLQGKRNIVDECPTKLTLLSQEEQ